LLVVLGQEMSCPGQYGEEKREQMKVFPSLKVLLDSIPLLKSTLANLEDFTSLAFLRRPFLHSAHYYCIGPCSIATWEFIADIFGLQKTLAHW
jgi:hypothetical protein